MFRGEPMLFCTEDKEAFWYNPPYNVLYHNYVQIFLYPFFLYFCINMDLFDFYNKLYCFFIGVSWTYYYGFLKPQATVHAFDPIKPFYHYDQNCVSFVINLLEFADPRPKVEYKVDFFNVGLFEDFVQKNYNIPLEPTNYVTPFVHACIFLALFAATYFWGPLLMSWLWIAVCSVAPSVWTWAWIAVCSVTPRVWTWLCLFFLVAHLVLTMN
jgi:hypothetical protein